jgi:hypothetical protein
MMTTSSTRFIGKLIAIISSVTIILTVLIGFAPALAFVPKTEGPSVVGNFQLVSEKGITRHIEFQATRNQNGSVAGAAIFRDDPTVNVEGSTEHPSDESGQPFFFKADFDCLVINENKAIMSGSISESSSKAYIGRRVLVVAQDNGGAKDPTRRDRLTWGVYRAEQKQWATSDAERPDDQSSQLSWIASDSERAEDEGVRSDKDQVIGCQSFPLSSFSFLSGNQIHGTVLVRP